MLLFSARLNGGTLATAVSKAPWDRASTFPSFQLVARALVCAPPRAVERQQRAALIFNRASDRRPCTWCRRLAPLEA